MGCNWVDANHTYFQIANLFLAFTYLVPNTLKGLIVLRLFLGTAGFFFTMWAGIILCSPDTLGWNAAFTFINFGHVAYLLYMMRPIKFDDEHEILYSYVFEHLGVARWQYTPVANIGLVNKLKEGDVIATENKTDGNSLSVLTSGCVRVMKNGHLVHRLKPYEFLDSPEWIASTMGSGAFPVTFEVTLISEGCVIIKWQRNALLKVLRQQKFLKNIFDSAIGQDVAKKLFKSNETMHSSKKYKAPTSSFVYHIEETEEETDESPTTISHKIDHGSNHNPATLNNSVDEGTPVLPKGEDIKIELKSDKNYGGIRTEMYDESRRISNEESLSLLM